MHNYRAKPRSEGPARSLATARQILYRAAPMPVNALYSGGCTFFWGANRCLLDSLKQLSMAQIVAELILY
ncbi:hypothetical protein BGP80_04895 [Pseudomonas putida]|uniref:Uncharacterized protein n=1 Tax=Pseudomonas putida TaxID=303 RepID=A0A2S3W8R9_PSEPU|nr:hypothetical protein BGP80_04895 [Pseudomonas putida]